MKMSLHPQKGAATLVITVIMVVSITLIILAAANYSMLQEKVTSNSYATNQAFEAAEAGLDFGIVYLQQNTAAIVTSPVNGYIPTYFNSSIQNVTLANGSTYSITYSNPVQNVFNLILVSSSGTSKDGTSTRTVSQKVAFGSLLSTPSQVPLVSKGAVLLTGNAIVSNPYANATINSALTIGLNGNAETLVTGGAVGSSSQSLGSDIQQSNPLTLLMSNTTFFQSYFGATEAAVQPTMKHIYTNLLTTDYSSTLNGMTGTSIWINQTLGQANISGNTTIGSAANPVLLIINGNLNLAGNATIYGFVYVIGGVATSLTGNSIINGGLISTATLNLAGNTRINYDSMIQATLQRQLETTYFARVPGTWRDF